VVTNAGAWSLTAALPYTRQTKQNAASDSFEYSSHGRFEYLRNLNMQMQLEVSKTLFIVFIRVC